MSNLDYFKKDAKRWLKALRANDRAAWDRLRDAYPKAPADPGLRDVQHALARERGHESWIALAAALARPHPAGPPLPPTGGPTHAERVATFLGFACWDHRVHGKGDHRMHDRAAARLLEQHPEIAHDSLYTAVVCGELEHVERILAGRPEAACEPGGSRGWTPLLYLCYTRFSHRPTMDNAVAIGRALLDRGANPNDFYMAGDVRYTALVGVAGEGEQDSPRQRQGQELFQLLLERGAEPFDIQVLYNTHFSGDVLWWLELIYAHTVKTGRKAAWDDPNWSMLDMGGYGPGAHYLLGVAVKKNDVPLAEWLLTHGASPTERQSSHPKFKPTTTLYQEAMRHGFTDMANLLVRYGAVPASLVLDDEDAFAAACFRMDREEVHRRLAEHPEYLRSPRTILAAARRDRADVVAFLLDLGVPIEVEGRHRERALHEAAAHNALGVARLLIERGAEIDPRETNWDATPIGWAAYGDKTEMVEFLSRFTRNIWTLVIRGYVDRLRDVLRAEPDLAKTVTKDGMTPLWWLPDDESRAVEIVELLLAHGADPSARSKDGKTAADWALKRGMTEVARKLAVPPTAGVEASDAPAPDLERFERLAQDVLFAYETGQAAAMQRLREHFGREFTWDELRASIRQRLELVPESDRPAGYFALAHARLLVARNDGFENWAALEATLVGRGLKTPPHPKPVAPESLDLTARMIQPVEMRVTWPVRLRDGVLTTTTDVWNMLTACRDGHLERVMALVAACPSLVLCDYNYMAPLHLAVREGHLDLVRYLADSGAANPNYVTYPYRETLVTLALDRGYEEIGQILRDRYKVADPGRPEDEGGEIDYGMDAERRRFQKLLNTEAVDEVETLLKQRPELARDPFAFWSEGVLMMPAKLGHRKMIEFLMEYGARVPDVSKWGAWYYLYHSDIAAFLLEHGMSPNHMNCHRTTVLHDMAYKGDTRKAALLLEHGAEIDAVDEEFRSTPLGLAARWGHRKMVALLLDRGADPNLSGAPWATPHAWARKKGHAQIEADLRQAGARDEP